MLYVKWVLGVSLFFSATASADVVLKTKKRTKYSRHSFMQKYDQQIAAMDRLSLQIGRKILTRDTDASDAQDKSGMKVALIRSKR